MSMRKQFEDAIFGQYFISTIKRNPNPPNIPFGGFDLIATADKTQAEFCAKRPDGLYIEDTLNAAWWAWQKALEPKNLTIHLKAEDMTMTLQEAMDRLLNPPTPDDGLETGL